MNVFYRCKSPLLDQINWEFYIFYNLPHRSYISLVPRRALFLVKPETHKGFSTPYEFLVKPRHLDTTFPQYSRRQWGKREPLGTRPTPHLSIFSITIIRDDYIGNIVFSDLVTNTVFSLDNKIYLLSAGCVVKPRLYLPWSSLWASSRGTRKALGNTLHWYQENLWFRARWSLQRHHLQFQ